MACELIPNLQILQLLAEPIVYVRAAQLETYYLEVSEVDRALPQGPQVGPTHLVAGTDESTPVLRCIRVGMLEREQVQKLLETRFFLIFLGLNLQRMVGGNIRE